MTLVCSFALTSIPASVVQSCEEQLACITQQTGHHTNHQEARRRLRLELKRAFYEIDVDGNGEISFDELWSSFSTPAKTQHDAGPERMHLLQALSRAVNTDEESPQDDSPSAVRAEDVRKTFCALVSACIARCASLNACLHEG
jgi:hypothetical protein